MSVTLDGQSLFYGPELRIEPLTSTRDSIERVVPGLSGVLSIDLGGRGRKIKQRGLLRARSRPHMEQMVNAIFAYQDGNTHTLIGSDGQEFDNVRMDSFEVTNERLSGGGIVVDYEIVYTQLVV